MPWKGTGEIIGVVAALIILLLMFRSVVAAGLPVVVAVSGLAVGSAGIAILCGFMSVSPFAPTVATMVGLGVGIDYALLMLTRALEYRRAGFGIVEAAAAANRTAGRAVVLAGTTVLVSLLGLRLSVGHLRGLRVRDGHHRRRGDGDRADAGSGPLRSRPPVDRAARRPPRPQGKPVRPAVVARADVRVGARAEGWARKVAGRPLPWLIGAATVT